MIALFTLLLAAPAHAADVWLSGGLSATPTAGDLFTPSWRLGLGAGVVNPWFTFSYASFDTALFGGDIDGFVVLPRVGARIDFIRPKGPLKPASFVGVTATSRVGRLTDSDDDVLEDAEVKGKIPYGIGLSGGLDAPLSEALSLSAEIGGEYYALGYEIDRSEVAASSFNTVAAVYVNLWL